MQPCAIPAPTGDTLGYLAVVYTLDLQQALARCNADKAALRLWTDDD